MQLTEACCNVHTSFLGLIIRKMFLQDQCVLKQEHRPIRPAIHCCSAVRSGVERRLPGLPKTPPAGRLARKSLALTTLRGLRRRAGLLVAALRRQYPRQRVAVAGAGAAGAAAMPRLLLLVLAAALLTGRFTSVQVRHSRHPRCCQVPSARRRGTPPAA
jgi:hypothetical protein